VVTARVGREEGEDIQKDLYFGTEGVSSS
jgi:hypothetical protein